MRLCWNDVPYKFSQVLFKENARETLISGTTFNISSYIKINLPARFSFSRCCIYLLILLAENVICFLSRQNWRPTSADPSPTANGMFMLVLCFSRQTERSDER